MPDIRVWTKQNNAVLDELKESGRFIARESFIRAELGDDADVMLRIYRWLAKHMPTADLKPDDAVYPVWVSFSKEAAMMPEAGYAVLELETDENLICAIDVIKWTMISNYSYIPKNEEDAENHNNLIGSLGISNAKAVMTEFYPEIKGKIIKSWEALFDPPAAAGDSAAYGLIWEVRAEWIRKITK